MKRGPILASGEERELMLFTHGFVLANVELDTLIDMMLDTNKNSRQNSTSLADRFMEIDADGSGSEFALQ